jgi:hypothetical protein
MERDLLSYGYLSAASDISRHTKAPLPAPTSLYSSGIAAIAEIINDEIGNWARNNGRDDQHNTQHINPASTNMKMSLNIKSVTITSDDELLALVTDALPEILGSSYELVSDDLPFDGNHILALNAKKQPFVISCDKHDGERALLSGLSVLEGLSEHRAIFRRLYPDVFNSQDQSQSPIEDPHLIVLSPNPPPGGAYLSGALGYLSFYTFHALQVDNRTGLFIEPCFTRTGNTKQLRDSISDKIAHAFRGGKKSLSEEETAYFQST